MPDRIVTTHPDTHWHTDPVLYLDPRTTCRVCGTNDLTEVHHLGTQFVSDFTREPTTTGVECPIVLDLCHRCGLVQQRYTAPQDLLYTRHYWYRSGVTDTMRAALADVVAAACARIELSPNDVVLDIGSNDGTLLRCYPPWVTRIGVEPAENLQEEGRKGLSFLLSEFWGGGTADTLLRHLGGRKAKVVTACGMFYDLEDPNPFVADVAKVLAPDGLFVAQLMCLKQTIERNDVGNLCHEHLEFYSLRSLETLFARHGLVIREVQENAVNGGSYRLFITHGEDSPHYSSYEAPLCLDEPVTYVIWQAGLERRKGECVRLVREAKAAGKSVWVYGASTKGNVILQWYGLDHTLIDGAADRSPEKWGRYTVGTGIKITSEEEARQKADVFLVLPYSFLTEFTERERAWRDRGGRFIVPLPEPRVI